MCKSRHDFKYFTYIHTYMISTVKLSSSQLVSIMKTEHLSPGSKDAENGRELPKWGEVTVFTVIRRQLSRTNLPTPVCSSVLNSPSRSAVSVSDPSNP